MEVNGHPAEAAFAVDPAGCGAGVDERLRALAIAIFDHEAAFLNGMGLILNGHAPLALFGGQALGEGVLGPGARDLAVQDGAIDGSVHCLAIGRQAGRSFMRDVSAGYGKADMLGDCRGDRREQHLHGDEIALVQKGPPEGDPQTLQGIHFTGLKAISFNNRSNAGRAVVLRPAPSRRSAWPSSIAPSRTGPTSAAPMDTTSSKGHLRA